MYSRRFPNRIIPTQGVRQHWSPLVAVLRGHSGSVYDLSSSPDGFRLASGSDNKTVRLWDGATGLPIATSKVTQMLLRFYHSHSTALELLRDQTTAR